MNVTALKASVPLSLKMLASDLNIEVRFSGSVPSWNGKVLNMSCLPYDSPDAYALASGFMIHELGHAQDTEIVGYPSKVHSCIGNALEDPRIEMLRIKKFPGARRILNDMVSLMVKRGHFGPPRKDDSIVTLVGFYALYLLRAEYLLQTSVQHLVAPYETEVRAQLPRQFAEIKDLILASEHAHSKKDVLDLTDKILALIPPALLEKEESKDPASSSGSGGPENVLPDTSEDESGSPAVAQFAIRSTDLADVAMPMFAALAEQAEKEEAPSMAIPVISESKVDPTEMILRSSSATNALRIRLEDMLTSLTHKRWHDAWKGPSVNVRNLWRLRTGDMKVFSDRHESVGLNTAIFMLLDRSGSMRKNLQFATDVSYAITSSLSDVDGLRIAAAAFPADVSHLGIADAQAGKGVCVLKGFDEQMRGVAGRFAALEEFGNTPLAEAVLFASGELLSENVERRILMIATDGTPDQLANALKALQGCDDMEIEIVVIGINADVHQLRRGNTRVDELEKLAPVIFGSLSNLLEQKAA